jgi:hypothetical protein
MLVSADPPTTINFGNIHEKKDHVPDVSKNFILEKKGKQRELELEVSKYEAALLRLVLEHATMAITGRKHVLFSF